MVERVLGEVPNVERVDWNWMEQVAHVRFAAGRTAESEVLKEAVTRYTMFTATEVTYLRREEDLPHSLR